MAELTVQWCSLAHPQGAEPAPVQRLLQAALHLSFAGKPSLLPSKVMKHGPKVLKSSSMLVSTALPAPLCTALE